MVEEGPPERGTWRVAFIRAASAKADAAAVSAPPAAGWDAALGLPFLVAGGGRWAAAGVAAAGSRQERRPATGSRPRPNRGRKGSERAKLARAPG